MAAKDRDALTKLPGKVSFDAEVARHMGAKGSAEPVSAAFFDVDRFLELNEKHGRESGDRVLIELARLFGEALGRGSTTFRVGGDEFAVLMPEMEKESAFLTLERIRQSFAELDALGDIDPHPAISIGIATFPDDGSTSQEVLRKADDALFRAKSAGRNRIALAREERKVPKTSHYTQGQLDRLSALSDKQGVGEAELLREALDDLLKKYSS